MNSEHPAIFNSYINLCEAIKERMLQVYSVSSANILPCFFRVCELVKQECATMELADVMWKADMYCAAHINGVWERGQICSDVTSSNIAEVKKKKKMMLPKSSLKVVVVFYHIFLQPFYCNTRNFESVSCVLV